MQKSVMCFGDSNTWGASPMPGGGRYDRQTRWPGVLQRELGEDYYVIEEGLPGRTTVWDDPVEGGKNGLKQLLPLIHSHAPLDLLIILLGTNDFKNRFSLSPLDIAWSIGRLVKTARDSSHPVFGPAPEVLVLCPPPLAGLSNCKFADILNGAVEKSHQLSTTLAQYCDEYGIRMFDAGTVVNSSTDDATHWDPVEHGKLGVAVSGLVRQILEN